MGRLLEVLLADFPNFISPFFSYSTSSDISTSGDNTFILTPESSDDSVDSEFDSDDSESDLSDSELTDSDNSECDTELAELQDFLDYLDSEPDSDYLDSTLTEADVEEFYQDIIKLPGRSSKLLEEPSLHNSDLTQFNNTLLEFPDTETIIDGANLCCSYDSTISIHDFPMSNGDYLIKDTYNMPTSNDFYFVLLGKFYSFFRFGCALKIQIFNILPLSAQPLPCDAYYAKYNYHVDTPPYYTRVISFDYLENVPIFEICVCLLVVLLVSSIISFSPSL